MIKFLLGFGYNVSFRMLAATEVKVENMPTGLDVNILVFALLVISLVIKGRSYSSNFLATAFVFFSLFSLS